MGKVVALCDSAGAEYAIDNVETEESET